MLLKKIVKHTNGVRHQIKIQKNLLSKYNGIIKRLSTRDNSASGRNNTGRITIRHQGAGCKARNHTVIIPQQFYAVVLNVMYNAKSNSFISLNFDLKRKRFFKSVSIKNIYTGSLVESNQTLTNFKLGSRAILDSLPNGSIINCVSNGLNKIMYAKSAGSYCLIVEKQKNSVKIKLPSGRYIFVSKNSYASLGSIDNSIFKLTVTGKAGRNRLCGIRPSVRGIAMNPVDHPHGGKSNKGMTPVTPWGIPTKNKPTVLKYKY
jgi:large subunit ribosomal protein L2